MNLKRKLKHQAKHCPYCGKELNNWEDKTIDHIIPRCKGGKTKLSNLLVCCFECNQKKDDRDLKDFIKNRYHLFRYLRVFCKQYRYLILDKINSLAF